MKQQSAFLPKPFIENVSLKAVAQGEHSIPINGDAILIQIVDEPSLFPKPFYKNFKEIHQFVFGDVEETDVFDDKCITPQQASSIIWILKAALAAGDNVIVQCVAGISRSGAVAEVGEFMGFREMGRHRIPNSTVKRKLLRELDLVYTPENSAFLQLNTDET